MAGLNIMSLYTDAYLADTIHLSTEQHGAYLLLLVAMWRAGGELSDDPDFLQRVTKVSAKRWPRMWEEIGHFFVSERKGSISQKQLRAEYARALNRKEVASLNGGVGGRANALKTKRTHVANASNPLKQTDQQTTSKREANEKQGFDFATPFAVADDRLSMLHAPSSLDSAANSESENATPKPAARLALDKLEAKCRVAADVVHDPSPSLLILQPIIAMLDNGYDLDTDVLPVLRKSAKAGRKGRSWAYYVEAIKESRDKARAAAGNGSGEHRSESKPAEPDESRWRKMWDWWKRSGEWPIVWGPDPLCLAGCEIPKELIERWSAET